MCPPETSEGRPATYETIDPNAAALVESLRDIGYTMSTAIADIVDNSLTAGAGRIEFRVNTDPASAYLAIIDDGDGMSKEELLEAMRPGSRTPTDARDPHDLGRFGLGLKTASFSQCRRLTVASRKAGVFSAAVWDLDLIVARNAWMVETLDDPKDVPLAKLLEGDGTIVVWEKIDRVGLDEGPATFDRLINDASNHLELVFHRFMRAEHGSRAVEMVLNGRPLQPADPFAEAHPATQHLTVDRRGSNEKLVVISPFILPHRNKVQSDVEWRRMGLSEGHMASQGFYLYRARRLIRHATWFGLARQHQLTELARVRIDIGNGSDAAWKIDVLKASGAPPPAIRAHLRSVLESLGGKSRKVYRKRGAKLTSENPLPLWDRVKIDSSVSYSVNVDHPVIDGILRDLDDAMARRVQAVLRLVSVGLPLEALRHDMADKPDGVVSGVLPDAELRTVGADLIARLRDMDFDDAEIARILRTIPPTNAAPAVIPELLKNR